MIPRCPCVSMGSNQWCLTEASNEVAHLLLSQDAIECRNEVAHCCFAVASYHIIYSLDMTDVVSLADSPDMGLI